MSSDITIAEYSATQAPTHGIALPSDNTVPADDAVARLEAAAQIKAKLAISTWGLLGTLSLVAFYLYCSYLPVYHSDIWGHVSYGTWMLQHGTLPVEDPFVELAGGVELINNAWLSQVGFGWVAREFGVAGISDAYTVLGLTLLLTLLAVFTFRTQSATLGLLAAFGTWGMVIFRLGIVRPELLGGICFALLLLQLTLIDRLRLRSSNGTGIPVWCWLTLPLTLTLWANLHGSFIIGLAALACLVAGSTLERLGSRGGVSGLLSDARWRSDLVLLELGVLAVCINPYGIDLLLQTLLFPTHPNLKSVAEWYPLKFLSLEGIPMTLSWVAAVFVIRHSREKFAVRDVLLLMLLTAAVLFRVRMIAWYAPVYFFVLAPHVREIMSRIGTWEISQRWQPRFTWLMHRSFNLTLIAGFACYLGFAFSPLSRHVMGGATRPDEKILSQQTPVGVSKYFAEHPPQGLLYAPQWWGDWLLWKSDHTLRVFVSTNSIHAVPASVWDHYMTISLARDGLDRLLSRYRIQTVVVSKDQQPSLVRAMRARDQWKPVFEDDISIIFKSSGSLAVPDSLEGKTDLTTHPPVQRPSDLLARVVAEYAP